MSIENVKAYLAPLGLESRVRELPVSSAPIAEPAARIAPLKGELSPEATEGL